MTCAVAMADYRFAWLECGEFWAGNGPQRSARERSVSLRKPKDEGERWVQLSLVSLGLFALMIVFFGIIPSFWLYFADGTLKWTGFWLNKLRDVIVTGYYVVVLGAFIAGVVVWNQRHAKVLPSGEEKREATGGYK
jgi:hypothetical protein